MKTIESYEYAQSQEEKFRKSPTVLVDPLVFVSDRKEIVFNSIVLGCIKRIGTLKTSRVFKRTVTQNTTRTEKKFCNRSTIIP